MFILQVLNFRNKLHIHAFYDKYSKAQLFEFKQKKNLTFKEK